MRPVVHAHQRTDAAAVFNLVRSVFSSIGVSLALTLFVVTSTTDRARLVEYVSPYSVGLRYQSGYTTGTGHGLAVLEREIEQQAAMTGYNTVFFSIALAALAGGLLADALLAVLKPSAARVRALRVFSLATPFSFFLLYFAALILSSGVWWRIHMWLGAPFLAGVVGLMLSYLRLPPEGGLVVADV